MKLDTKIADLSTPLTLCLKCGMCIYGGEWPENYTLCSIFQSDGRHIASAAGILNFLKAVSDDKIGYTATIADIAYKCPTCGVCDMCEVVPVPTPHAKPTEFIRFLRYQVVKEGLIPDGNIKEIYKQVKDNGDYPGQMVSLLEKIRDDNAQVVLFADCIHSKSESKIYQAALNLLEKMGQKVALYADGGCCGSTLYNLGFWDELNTLMAKKAAIMSKLKGKQVLFINPHCQEFMQKRSGDIAAELKGITGRHFSELLADALKDGKLKTKEKQNIKVSYHDPCYLGREMGICEAPRKVLSYINGLELIEMKRNRLNAYCCGAGGGGRIEAYPDFSRSMAESRIEEFKETGAELLITACPYCKEVFQKVLPEKEKNKIKDIIEFVDERTS
ncbi:(Fe-S)-binding protein [Chloroflexota bacterium]